MATTDTVCTLANKLYDLQKCGYCKSAYLPVSCPAFANQHLCKFAFMANLKMGIVNSVQQDMINTVAASINANLVGLKVDDISWNDFTACKIDNAQALGDNAFFERQNLLEMGYAPAPLIGDNFLANNQTIGPFAYSWMPTMFDAYVNPVFGLVIAITILVLSVLYSFKQYKIKSNLNKVEKSSYNDIAKEYLKQAAKVGITIDT